MASEIASGKGALRLWPLWTGGALSLGAFALMLVGVFQEEQFSSSFWQFLRAPSPLPVGYYILGMAFLTLALCAFFIFALSREQALRVRVERDIYELSQERDATRLSLEESERQRRIDRITTIPNYLSWEAHLDQWYEKQFNEREFVLILIDLDNFRALNKRPRCADAVLKYFARKTYDSMRRDEFVYKAPNATGPIAPSRFAEMFRHYAGGDEFFFVLTGDIYGGLGFLNRLNDRLPALESDIKANILQAHLPPNECAAFRLAFRGVAMSVLPGEDPGAILADALNLLDRAKNDPQSRLILSAGDGAETPHERADKIAKELQSLSGRISSNQTDEEKARLEAQAQILKARLGVTRRSVDAFTLS